MLISLSRTYRGRTHKWWFQSGAILALAIILLYLTYYFIKLYTEVQWLRAENKRLTPYVFVIDTDNLEDLDISVVDKLNYAYEYLQYLHAFEAFEQKAKLAKWMRVYHSKQVLDHQKNELEIALSSDMIAPVMMALGKELSSYSQQWDSASLLEKNKIHIQFKQSMQIYEMVAKHQGHKILSSDWMRQIITRSWYQVMRNQSQKLPSYQEIYPKLDSLVEFYFQMPTMENEWIKPDSALLEKTKNQLQFTHDIDVFVS